MEVRSSSMTSPGSSCLPQRRASEGLHPGEPWPLGAHTCCDGTNFAVFSRHAIQMELWLFEAPDAPTPSLRVPIRHRTGDIWHVRIPEDLRGRCYALRALGPEPSGTAARFDPQQLLLDPYARVIVHSSIQQVRSGDARVPGSFRRRAVSVVIRDEFDWQGVASPRRPWSDTVIYEMHVRGFTQHVSSGVLHRGQYLGVVERKPYLQSLGVTAVELLPVQAFETENIIGRGLGLVQYWGYNPIALFAPHSAYASDPDLEAPLREFKTMVRELHRAGIEVILDVVFNHTGEAGEAGPMYSFRGVDNEIYYMLSEDGARYLDYTGCGNTLNCNHPVVRSMILRCLRHWVVDLHIDGFRFDLAAVLGRGGDGALLSNPPLLEAIAEDPILRDVKLIAEAWDAAGAFQVGRFGSERWGEWNCCFRDDVRRFWRGDPGFSGRLASRLCGSADLYQRNGATPLKSINFVTSHDGFTLNDLVSFATKHNEANGEGNRDGAHENFSSNHGVEGVIDDVRVADLRRRQVKNMLATLLLSRGVPMLLGGDEFGRSQRGNNNAYCQDNEISWYDWAYAEKNADLIGFVRRLIELRRRHAALRADHFYSEQEIVWFGPAGGTPDWHGAKNQLGCVVVSGPGRIALLFNAATEPCDFALPPALGDWRVAINTSAAPPADAPDAQSAAFIENRATVQLAPCSMLVLTSMSARNSA